MDDEVIEHKDPRFAALDITGTRKEIIEKRALGHGIAIGNLIGSDLFNLLGVLGLAGMINPSIIAQDIFNSVFLLVLMVGLTLLLIRTNWRISRLEGTLLVTINLVRRYFDFAN